MYEMFTWFSCYLQTTNFSKSEGHHHISNIRMPYHQLLSDSLPIKIIGECTS